MKSIELLSPAKDSECGKAAILCGADAVCIGAPRFGARRAASATIEEIESLCRFAHVFHAKVYAALNTLLYEEELEDASQIAYQLQNAGVDGIIFQDPAVLTFGLKEMPFIASTQTFSNTAAKIKFWQETGVQRVILPRELSLNEIKAIRKDTEIELEFFVHGALCVSFSGQCYMSRHASGRSANRGECAQMCRHVYSLYDENENLMVADRHLLSLKDLNLSEHLESLLGAGITSFKIEGRLKDIAYVKNVTAYYRKKLDEIISRIPDLYQRSSAGSTECGFEPDPAKTFSRGFTDFFLIKRQKYLPEMDTPKSTGEYAGIVSAVSSTAFRLDSAVELFPGDGIVFAGKRDVYGTRIEKTDGKFVIPASMEGIEKGVKIFRNHNHHFLQQVSRAEVKRKIELTVDMKVSESFVSVRLCDTQGITSEYSVHQIFAQAEKKDKAIVSIHTSFLRTGDTEYTVKSLDIHGSEIPFVPLSVLNTFRREALENHSRVRSEEAVKNRSSKEIKVVPYPENETRPGEHVINSVSSAFYRERGVTGFPEPLETAYNKSGQRLMQMKYCIKFELGMCKQLQKNPKPSSDTLLLADNNRRYRLEFDCPACQMKIVST